MHRPEPPHPQQLRDAARILAVSLVHHGRQRCLHVPRLEQHHLKPGRDQASVQPLRQRARLQADPRHANLQTAEEPDQGLRLAGHLRLAHDPAGAIHHAHAALFQ
jgi:hypothetical protein